MISLCPGFTGVNHYAVPVVDENKTANEIEHAEEMNDFNKQLIIQKCVLPEINVLMFRVLTRSTYRSTYGCSVRHHDLKRQRLVEIAIRVCPLPLPLIIVGRIRNPSFHLCHGNN